jgi:hypothetical protein
MQRFFRQFRGQVLVEAIIALGILTIGFLGIFNLLSQSIGASRTVSESYTATYLAGEGVELMKFLWDKNQRPPGNGSYELQYNVADSVLDCPDAAFPLNPFPLNVNDCTWLRPSANEFLYFDPATGLYNYNRVGTKTGFKRIIDVQYNPSCADPLTCDHVRVRSRVTWITRGGANFQVQLEDHFFAPHP